MIARLWRRYRLRRRLQRVCSTAYRMDSIESFLEGERQVQEFQRRRDWLRFADHKLRGEL